MEQTYLSLNNGLKMPQFGADVYQVAPKDIKQNVLEVLELGYRHIDTVHAYRNEREVGQAVKESGFKREDIFITSKLWLNGYADGPVIDKMLVCLDTDYIDLLSLYQ